MRLSDDKINHLSHVLLQGLKEWETAIFKKPDNDVRLIVKDGLIEGLTDIENLEEKVKNILQSYSRKLEEGSREWDVMFAKTFEEELQKLRPVRE